MKNTLTRKILSIILAITVIFGALPVFAVPSFAASTSDLTFELNDYGDGYIVSDCITSASGELVIPSEYNDLPVTEVRDFAFYGCASLKSVTVPSSVTYIGEFALGYEQGDLDYSKIDGFVINGYTYSAAYDYAMQYDVTFNSIGEVEQIKYELNWSEDGYELASCAKNYSGELVIPSEYNGLPVTEIGYEAFCGCTSLTSVTIPDSVTSIGEDAFSGCTSLTSVTIPDSVTSIGWGAFYDCTSLTSVTIPDSVTSIYGYAFLGCTSLTSVTIPDSVTSIGWGAFRGCTSLTSVTIPDSVTEIYWGAFLDCTSLKSATIPSSVTYIDDWAFGYEEYYDYDIGDWVHSKIDGFVINGYTYSAAYEYALENDIIFNSIGEVEQIKYELNWSEDGYELVSCTKSYSGSLVIPSEYNGLPVTEIGYEAFCGCTSLTAVTIPDSVTSIYGYAFEDCTSLTSVTIPDSVTNIGEAAFMDCKSLKSVTIPSSVTIIGEYAFAEIEGEGSVEDFVINGYTYSAAYDYALENDITFNSIGEVEQIKYELNWSEDGYELVSCTKSYSGSLVIPSEYNGLPVTEIGYEAFCGCTSLTFVTIPDSVTSIGLSAFRGCTSLTAVTIPDSVTEIYWGAFLDCTSLKSVTILSSVTFIANMAFGYESDMDNWVFAKINGFVINGYTYSEAHDYAAKNDITFNSIGEVEPLKYELNEDMKSYTFSDCSYAYATGNITIASKYNCFPVTKIGNGAFRYCENLTSVIIPNTVTEIDSMAFYGCKSLATVTIPDSVLTINNMAFGYLNGSDDEFSPVPYKCTIHGYAGSEAERYASENGFKFVAITKVSDESTGISVAGELAEGTTLIVKELGVEGNMVTFDITLTKNGVAIQPDGNVTVKIPVPKGLDGDECKVYRKEADGTYTNMNAVCDGTYLIFTTDHFSEYVVTTEKLDVVYGDANGDGKVDLKDVVLLRQYMANYVYATGTSSVAVKPGADANGDGKTDLKDVVLLRQYMANYSYDTESSTVVLGPR